MGTLLSEVETHDAVDLLIAVRDVVDRAAEEDQIVYANQSAHDLQRRFPDLEMSVAEIATLIARACVVAGRSVEIGE